MASTRRDYYEVLGVSRDADEDTLKRAYRTLAMKYHPDRNPGDQEAELRFKEASEAFDVLRDPQRRARYDRYGFAGLEGVPGHDFTSAESVFDVFGDVLSEIFGGGPRRRGPRRGSDLRVAFEIDLIEAYRGTKRELKIPRAERCGDCGGTGAKPGSQPIQCRHCGGRGSVQISQGIFRIRQGCPVCHGQGMVIGDPCKTCRGQGIVQVERALTVDVPRGIDDGQYFTLPGEGEAGDPGAPAGDLHCIVRVRAHKLFARDGLDLHCEVPISFSQAALGDTLEVPTLDGKYATAKLKAGTQSGDEIRLSGRGMPHPQGRRSGDLVVHLRVVTPRNLTKRQDELFRELHELDGKHLPPERKGFLDRVKEFFTTLTGANEEQAGETKRP
jgi:molecular chaperone DnaJ